MKKKHWLISLAIIIISIFLLKIPGQSQGVIRDTLVTFGQSKTVYYIDDVGLRHSFPNQQTYQSWFGNNFSQVYQVPETDLTYYSLGDNITVRPGTKMIKLTTDPKVYVIEPPNYLRWLSTEELALQLYGTDWNTRVIDMPDVFFGNYVMGDPITEAVHPWGTLVKFSEADVIYYMENGTLRPFSTQAFNDNNFSEDNIITISKYFNYPQEAGIFGQEDLLSKLVLRAEQTEELDLAHGVEPETYVRPARCGNGVIEGTEECDDDNLTDGDGCSSICKIEEETETVTYKYLRVSSLETDEEDVYENRETKVQIGYFRFNNDSNTAIEISKLTFAQTQNSALSRFSTFELVGSNTYSGTVSGNNLVFNMTGSPLEIPASSLSIDLRLRAIMKTANSKIELSLTQSGITTSTSNVNIGLATNTLYSQKINVLDRPDIEVGLSGQPASVNQGSYNNIGTMTFDGDYCSNNLYFNELTFSILEQDISDSVEAMVFNNRLISPDANDKFVITFSSSQQNNCQATIKLVLSSSPTISGASPQIALKLEDSEIIFSDYELYSPRYATLTPMPWTSDYYPVN